MALRVLLADESATIKKVMQLALQDFDVEVKSVAVGVDVLTVAWAFEPHIIFADVLLAKKSGYEVCADIKNDPKLKNIPCVLMWSGFMELDEAKAKSSKANKRLEKPFDAEALRSLVRDLVPETHDNVISNFLTFPHLADFVETPASAKAPTKAPPPPPRAPSENNSSGIPTVELDEVEEFQQVPLPTQVKSKKTGPSSPGPQMSPISAAGKKDADSWSHQDLSRFKLNIPTEDLTPDYDDSNLADAQIAISGSNKDVGFDDLEKQTSVTKTAAATSATIDVHHMEEIIRQQVREVLQDIAWKVLPDLAERILREEIQKLMKESEKLS
jgi:two-component system cell cycle response regulator